MAFPVVEATNVGNSGANVTQTTVPNPTGAGVGDLVLHYVAKDGGATFTINGASTGWTLISQVAQASAVALGVYYKWLDGSGDTLILDHESQGTAWASYRISGAEPEALENGDGGSGNANTSPWTGTPVAAPWGADDNLWVGGYAWDGDVSLSAYATGLPDNRIGDRWANANGCGVALSSDNYNASDTKPNPGTATLSASEQWRSRMVTVRPAAAVLTLDVGKVASAEVVRGIDLTASGPVALSLGKIASTEVVRGIDLGAAGSLALLLGKVPSGELVRGIDLDVAGPLALVLGKVASGEAVRGIDLSLVAGGLTLDLGKIASGEAVRGLNLTQAGPLALELGKVAGNLSFGKNALGANDASGGMDAGAARGSLFSVPGSVALDGVDVYYQVATAGTGGQPGRVLVYRASDGALMGVTDEVSVLAADGDGFRRFPFAAALSLAAGDYWLLCNTGAYTGTARFNWRGEAVGTGTFYSRGGAEFAYPGSPDPLPANATSNPDRTMAIYAVESDVFGLTLSQTGPVVLELGKVASGELLRGLNLSQSGPLALLLGKIGSAALVRGIGLSVPVEVRDVRLTHFDSGQQLAHFDSGVELVAFILGSSLVIYGRNVRQAGYDSNVRVVDF